MQSYEKIRNKKLVKVGIAAIFIIAFGIMFAPKTDRDGGGGGDIEPEYKWMTLQVIDFDTEEEYFGFIMTECYDMVTLPPGAVELNVRVDFKGGDKDSYVKLTLWRWGEDDDVNIGQIYENAKQGSEDFTYKKVYKGNRYYVEASMISNLEGTITVKAKVPI